MYVSSIVLLVAKQSAYCGAAGDHVLSIQFCGFASCDWKDVVALLAQQICVLFCPSENKSTAEGSVLGRVRRQRQHDRKFPETEYRVGGCFLANFPTLVKRFER